MSKVNGESQVEAAPKTSENVIIAEGSAEVFLKKRVAKFQSLNANLISLQNQVNQAQREFLEAAETLRDFCSEFVAPADGRRYFPVELEGQVVVLEESAGTKPPYSLNPVLYGREPKAQ